MSVDTTRDTLEDFLDINLLNRDDELTISDFAGGKAIGYDRDPQWQFYTLNSGDLMYLPENL